jgi:SPP1 gp7 family putative phage head morphogenesis protein
MPEAILKPVPHKEAADFIHSKPVVSRQVFDQLLPDLRARAITVTGIEDANVVRTIRDLIAEVPQGRDWDEAKKEIAAQISPWTDEEHGDKRAELLLRAHGYQAYQAAQYEVMDRQRAAFPYWQYQTADDDRVRDTHAALDGLVVPADSPFWDAHYPPWDFNCRCFVAPLSEADVADLRDSDERKKPEERRVLDAERLRQLESSGRLTRALPGENGMPREFNVTPRSPAQGGYSFQPGTLKMSAEDLRPRYDAETFKVFEEWAKATRLEDSAERTVWSWLNERPAAPRRTARRVTRPAPEPASAPAPQRETSAPAARKAPVSAALDVRTKLPIAKEIKASISAIDRVHDDGALPRIAVGAERDNSALGRYWPTGDKIAINSTGPWPQMTTAHEVGHLLDYKIFGVGNSFASAASAEFATWREAVQASAAIRGIVASRNTAMPIYNSGYLLQEREIWARAYAQYIATRSGDVEMLRQLNVMRSRPGVGTLIQWSDEDFKPIAAAMDDIFRKKGWIA